MKNDYLNYIKKEVKIQDICHILGIPVYTGVESDRCCCPFHDDHNPSMVIYKNDNHAFCFSCYKQWDSLDFVGDKLDLDFDGRIKWMERHFPKLLSQKPQYIVQEEKDVPASGYDIAYHSYATMSTEESTALTEYAKGRGYKDSFLIKNEIFFSRGGKLTKLYAQEEDRYIEERTKLNTCQLLIKLPWQEKAHFQHYADYFSQDGMILTIRDSEQRIVGFSQRALGDNKPKYRFTKGLPKKTILYGMERLSRYLSSIKSEQIIEFYLVEGMFDALRLASHQKYALAVLGSQLTQTQTLVLENLLINHNNAVSIHIFMDGDEAGNKGNIQTLKNLWNRNYFRHQYIDIVIPGTGKDPDECLNTSDFSNLKAFSPFEYLVRYFAPDRMSGIPLDNTLEGYNKLCTEDRIICLNRIKYFLIDKFWGDLFKGYGEVSAQQEPFYRIIKDFISGIPDDANQPVSDFEKTELYQFQSALQIARTSYDRESLPLDDSSWERIQNCADVFFEFFKETLLNKKNLNIPLLAIYYPKKPGEERLKGIYIHERLILQQYVLNELLGTGTNQYEYYIPAVRYSQRDNFLYTTANGAIRTGEETVSFAYEIDMDVLSGGVAIEHGMFRGYYDCWKSYIGYIQDGISHLASERIYRVKLDIRGFYDNIPRYAVRDVLFNTIKEALRVDGSKLALFKSNDDEDVSLRAEKITHWILEELFEPFYYSPKSGQKEEKSNVLVGIPQGPNLSAYIANILLFTIDQAVLNRVTEINTDAPEGTIIARYARYVDDMIIISSDANILMELKSLISSKLYDLGLVLSPKTEREDSVSKEEALEWTTDERGGLGVSTAFDFPDDTVDYILDEYDGYEVTDRRSALKLLESALFLTEDELLKKQVNSELLIETLFKTQEIRFSDIVRISEILLIHAVNNLNDNKESNLLTEFLNVWNLGKKASPTDSLIQYDGTELFAFIESCNKVLKRKLDSMRFKEQNQIWRTVREAILQYWASSDFTTTFIKGMEQKELLSKNAWILQLRFLEIRHRLNLVAKHSAYGEKNEFYLRWNYALMEYANAAFDYPIYGEERTLLAFHHTVSNLTKLSDKSLFSELKSSFINGSENIFATPDSGILGRCLLDWFSDNSTIQDKSDHTRISFLTLLNLLVDPIKADIIEQIPLYKNFIFLKKVTNFSCLPIVPGVGYPGLLATAFSTKTNKKIIRKIDLIEPEGIIPESCWEEYDCIDQYKMLQLPIDNDFLPVDEFFELLQNNDSVLSRSEYEKQILCLLRIYQVLSNKIKNIQEENSEASVILSKRNVFIKIDNKTGEPLISITTYLLPRKNTGHGVLLEQGKGKYSLTLLHNTGSYFWEAGYLLKDASNFDALRLQYISNTTESDGQKMSEVLSMMEYTFNRLTGSSVNRQNTHKSIHSYENSVKRAIETTQRFLSEKENRDIFLEDNAAIDSFIRQRMGRESYYYAPSECSYYTAVWSKVYLRTCFDRLMNLAQKENCLDSQILTDLRRVPKAYLCLADRIDSLTSIITSSETSFQGLEVLKCGLRADAVLLQLRMQTLELIESLNSERKEKLKKQIPALPFAALELEEDFPLTVEHHDISILLEHVLDGKSDKNIGKITHIGWFVLLKWLLDFENCDENGIISKKLKSLCGKICSDVQEANDNSIFPFECMTPFFSLWTNSQCILFFELCKDIDRATHTKVQTLCSDFQYWTSKGQKVTVVLDNHLFEKPNYFLTLSKLNDSSITIEQKDGNPDKCVYTQSVRDGKIVGVSIIEIRLGNILQEAEKAGKKGDKKAVLETIPLLVTEDPPQYSADSDASLQTNPIENSSVSQEIADMVDEPPKPPIDSSKGSEPPDKPHGTPEYESGEPDDYLGKLEKWLMYSLGKRKKRFQNYNRIALFQFDAANSYFHPSTEACKYKKSKAEDDFVIDGLKYSCSEFKRQKLLLKVLELCSYMNVDILLLPEYSVRPETVEFLREEIKNSKYHFSIWAGTFRITPDYQFSGGAFQELVGLKDHVHAAVLPIIMPDRKQVYCGRMKKYPSLTLNEDINPAVVLRENFKPVTEILAKRAADGTVIPYNDARDHVTELICAEVFALSSPGNILSFTDKACQLYNNYISIVEDEAKKNFDVFSDSTIKDVETYGRAISLYRPDNDFCRKSIVLVPACTTRAADYYVLGQANYLGSGTNMVFCNGSGKLAQGGSCFIGQNSWDDIKTRGKKAEAKGITSIYNGSFPGIYMQASDKPGRGALGPAEQALLVCDVIPDLDKRQPNPESMRSSLEVVAHIPFFVEHNYADTCIGNCRNEKKKYLSCLIKKETQNSIAETKALLKELYTTLENGLKSSGQDPDPTVIARLLYQLGKKYKSDWLVERGQQYYIGHKLFPKTWMPETALDWCYLELNYQEFLDECKDRYRLQVPDTNNSFK